MRRLHPPLIAALTLLPTPALGEAPMSLERAIELALTRNERAKQADLSLEASEARLSRARAFFFPALTAAASYTRRANETTRTDAATGTQLTIQAKDALNASVTLDVPLFDASAFPLFEAAKLDREAAALSAEDQKRRLAFEAAGAFLLTLGNEKVREAAAKRVELARSTVAEARARFSSGLVGSNDVTRAELELATAERERVRAESGAAIAYAQLGFLVGAEVHGPLADPKPLLTEARNAQLPAGDSPGLADQARARRPDVAAEARRAESLRAFADEPIQRVWPRVGLVGQYRATNEGGLSGRVHDGSLSAQLSWSLFDGGERYAEADERAAGAAIAELRARAIARQVDTEVRTALIGVAGGQAAVGSAEAAGSAARKNAGESAALYRQGLTTAFAVADATQRLFEAEVAEAREELALAIAYLDLRAALGAGPLGPIGGER